MRAGVRMLCVWQPAAQQRATHRMWVTLLSCKRVVAISPVYVVWRLCVSQYRRCASCGASRAVTDRALSWRRRAYCVLVLGADQLSHAPVDDAAP